MKHFFYKFDFYIHLLPFLIIGVSKFGVLTTDRFVKIGWLRWGYKIIWKSRKYKKAIKKIKEAIGNKYHDQCNK